MVPAKERRLDMPVKLISRSVISAVIPFFLFVITLAAESAQAQGTPRENVAGDDTPTIFDVRKSLPMEPTDPTFHDFYINAGVEVGFKKGQYLPVSRALPVHDPVQNKQQGILTVPVGKVLVIHVERNMAVARLASELGDDERPTLEYEAIMIGDRVDMRGITTEAPKSTKKKKKTAAVEEASTPVLATMNVESTTVPAPVKESATVPAVAVPVKSDTAAQPQPSLAEPQPTSTQPQRSSAPQRVTQPVPPPTA